MRSIQSMLQWFPGGGGYRKLAHCMNYDTFRIALTVVLDLTVVAGYVFIAAHWGRNERRLEQSAAKSALGSMKRIFVLCGVCGYLFIPIKLFWPAWRLYDLSLAVLAYSTWRYALSAQELRVVYEQLDMTEQLGACWPDRARWPGTRASSSAHSATTCTFRNFMHVSG